MGKEEIIKKIADKFSIDVNTITEDSNFTDDLHLDSIDLVETLMEIEEKNNIQVKDEDAIKIKTVGDFINIILKEING